MHVHEMNRQTLQNFIDSKPDKDIKNPIPYETPPFREVSDDTKHAFAQRHNETQEISSEKSKDGTAPTDQHSATISLSEAVKEIIRMVRPELNDEQLNEATKASIADIEKYDGNYTKEWFTTTTVEEIAIAVQQDTLAQQDTLIPQPKD